MKNITLLLLLVGMMGMAQIKGNRTIETKRFVFDNVETIKINVYAKVTIDHSAEPYLEITTDNNLFELIDTEIIDGTIHLDQIKWIQPSQDIVIKIGAPDLKRLEHGTHDTTKVVNIKTDTFQVTAPIGHIVLQGETNELRLASEIGQIDASQLIANKIFVNLWDSGTIKINPESYLSATVSNDGKLLYTKLPDDNKLKTKSGGKVLPITDYKNQRNDIQWISFKIKNNSDNRNNFIVRGPKADGSFFGYGFPMMPNAKRKEKWSVGTKIYKQTSLGFKKLLVVITAEDEGKVLNLF